MGSDPQSYHHRGDWFARYGRWAEAAADFRKAVDIDPTPHLLWYELSALRLKLGDVEGYRSTCRDMLARFADDPTPTVADRTAKACLMAPHAVSDYRPVLRLAERAVTGTEKHTDYTWFLSTRGMADYRAGNFAGATNWLQKSLATDHRATYLDGLAYLFLSMAHHHLGQGDDARLAMMEARAIERRLPRVDAGPIGGWVDWLWFYILLREAEEVQSNAPTTQRQDPQRAPERGGLPGVRAERTRRIDRLLSQAGDDVQLRLRLIDSLRLADDLDGAIQRYSELIEKHPQLLEAWRLRGDCHLRKGDFANAVVDFSRAIKLQPNDWLSWRERGLAHLSLRQHHDAIADHSRAIELNREDVFQMLRRARSYEAIDEIEEAEADYRKALTLKDLTRQPGFVNFCAWRLVSNPTSKISPQVAVALAERAVAASPRDGYLWSTLGVGKYRAGDWKGAIEALSKSMEFRGGGDGNDWFFIAMAHWQLGDEDQARHWYDRAAAQMEQKPSKNKQLLGFRAEAEALLKIGGGSSTQPAPIAASKAAAD